MRWKSVASVLVLGLIAAIFGGWYWLEEHRFRRDLAQAEKEMADGRYRPARQQLAELTKRRPGSTEAAYQLGLCEDVLGHKAAAMKIWSGIAPGSPFFIQAALGRVLLLMNAGKFSPAEDLLLSLPRNRGAYAGHVRSQLELLLRIEGREKEARSLIVESWPGGAGPSDVLKRLFMLEDAPFPLDYVREALARGDQNDDRFWLGRANLATWCGRYEEANRWLDPCERRGPRTRLSGTRGWRLAMASGDYAGARRAVEHLKAAWLLPNEVLRLRAWFAAFRGEEVERQSLLALVAVEPGNTAAWARLAELCAQGRSSFGCGIVSQEAGRDERASGAVRGAHDARRPRSVRRRAGSPRERAGTHDRSAGLVVDPARAAALAESLSADLALNGDAVTRAPMLEPRLHDLFPDPGDVASRRSPPEAAVFPRSPTTPWRLGLRFVHERGGSGKFLPPPETMSGGVGLLDYDGDGWIDVYAVQSARFLPVPRPTVTATGSSTTAGTGRSRM